VIQYQHQKMQDKNSDEHKHCTLQPFDTAFGAARDQTFGWGTCSLRLRNAFCSYRGSIASRRELRFLWPLTPTEIWQT